MKHLVQHLIDTLSEELQQEERNICNYNKVSEKDLILLATGKRMALETCLSKLRNMLEYENQLQKQ
jgi:hypothetical protein